MTHGFWQAIQLQNLILYRQAHLRQDNAQSAGRCAASASSSGHHLQRHWSRSCLALRCRMKLSRQLLCCNFKLGRTSSRCPAFHHDSNLGAVHAHLQHGHVCVTKTYRGLQSVIREMLCNHLRQVLPQGGISFNELQEQHLLLS